jgi:endonuclease/exonuclease/phosphatase family metal-dependent hydrolase
MITRRRVSLASLAPLFLLSILPTPVVAADGAALAVRVMTYNLRYASESRPNAWADRRPMMARLIRRHHPDVFGTQEGLYGQLKELQAALPDYDWIGLGRDGGSRGEFMAIFFKRARFEPVAFDHFWLSDTPEVIGSATWGHSNRRMVTWVRLREKTTRRELVVWNTHFDHEVETARQKSAELIRDRLRKEDAALPLVLTGDFNCKAGDSPAYEVLTQEVPLVDTWAIAARRQNEGVGTFNDFKTARKDGTRIDWILARGALSVPFTGVITDAESGRYPSDHFPVLADLVFK